MTTPPTAGEKAFERYLVSAGVPFEFEKPLPGKAKIVDFQVPSNGGVCCMDVKDLESPSLEEIKLGPSVFDPYAPIRRKIAKCREKFGEYKEFCCAGVFFNSGSLTMLEDTDVMLGSMYGNRGVTIPVDTESGVADANRMQPAFLHGGKMVGHGGEAWNTTISALITLTSIRNLDNELVPRVIVWHNLVARIQFPPDLFCGPYDAHVGMEKTEDGKPGRIVAYCGSLLPANATP